METTPFIRDVASRLRCDPPRAEALTFIVLRALRTRLPDAEVADVRAQLPRAIQRMWDEEHGPVEAPRPGKHATDLIGHVRSQAGLADDGEAERAVRAVFRSLQSQLGSPTGLEGEAWDLFSVLPKEWQRLWVDSASKPAPESVR